MRLISKAELARWAGVSAPAISKACRVGGPLYDAASSEGVDAEHPLVRQWLAGHGVHKLPDPPQARPKAKPKAKPKRGTARRPTPPPKPKADPPPAPPQLDELPGGIEDLENLTVREVVMRYGSVDGFKRFVDSLKGIAEYKHRELRVRQQRGDLIERDRVAGVVFPLLEVAFSRLVGDVPESVSKLVVARAEAGGPETTADVVQLIRDANSRVLKNLKESAARMEFLTDEN